MYIYIYICTYIHTYIHTYIYVLLAAAVVEAAALRGLTTIMTSISNYKLYNNNNTDKYTVYQIIYVKYRILGKIL